MWGLIEFISTSIFYSGSGGSDTNFIFLFSFTLYWRLLNKENVTIYLIGLFGLNLK